MKVSKAIEILNQSVHPFIHSFSQDEVNALKLGIEALKQLQGLHKLAYGSPLPPLPGETPEEEVNHVSV